MADCARHTVLLRCGWAAAARCGRVAPSTTGELSARDWWCEAAAAHSRWHGGRSRIAAGAWAAAEPELAQEEDGIVLQALCIVWEKLSCVKLDG